MNLSAARRLCCAAALIVVIATPTVANDDPWPSLALDVFNGRALEDGSKVLVLDMPSRAEDAAIVPVTMRVTLPAADLRRLKALTLVIDQNPAPVAATFLLGESSGVTSITTRVRVDAYTNVHAVAELSDGKLYVVQTYVKASGGCSAPADKNPEEAKKNAGQMRLVQFSKPADGPFSSRREAQIMIRHPNNSGLQMDQVTRHYVPAFFVREMRVWQGDELVMSMESGISLSEDPNIRFDYIPNGAKGLRVEAIDTDDRKFKGEWPINSSAM